MKKTIIAFDVDWTLIKICAKYLKYKDPSNYNLIANDRIIELLKILHSFKNIKIIVWSWQWEDWARLIVSELGLCQFVDWYASKNHKGKDSSWKHIFEPDIIPDICIDDIHACELWKINLIVNEK